ncbi:hypothetical protein [Mesorhizobium sp. STM 4661]|uniref:RNA polymerase factor sigma-54 n=1 Tax=Mesorhizobium sp. STM 4661 TaxID=1297570 RepID=UPI00329A4892
MSAIGSRRQSPTNRNAFRRRHRRPAQGKGHRFARRTVTKYREAMNVPSSVQCRREWRFWR